MSKYSDIEFSGLSVREQPNIQQDSIMRFLFHGGGFFCFFFCGGVELDYSVPISM